MAIPMPMLARRYQRLDRQEMSRARWRVARMNRNAERRDTRYDRSPEPASDRRRVMIDRMRIW